MRTGATDDKQLAGTSPSFVTAMGRGYLGPDGSVYLATGTGLLRFVDGA